MYHILVVESSINFISGISWCHSWRHIQRSQLFSPISRLCIGTVLLEPLYRTISALALCSYVQFIFASIYCFTSSCYKDGYKPWQEPYASERTTIHPNKRNHLGIKLVVIYDCLTGFVLDFIVYTVLKGITQTMA